MVEFYISCALGFEKALQDELIEFWPYLLDTNSRPHAVPLEILGHDKGGILIRAPEVLGFQINFFSKLANRVLMRLGRFKAKDFIALEMGLKQIDLKIWQSHRPFVLNVSASESRLNNEKRIIETALRAWKLEDVEDGQSVFLRMHDDVITVSMDTTGEHLHQRSLRALGGVAPLRETLAAFILRQLIHQSSAAELQQIELVDPMTGSGTFLSEARSLYTANLRRSFAFQEWSKTPALLRSGSFAHNYKQLSSTFGQLRGYDSDEKAVEIASREMQSSAVIQKQNLFDMPALPQRKRWVVVNPPYDKRLQLDFSPEQLLTAIDRVFQPERVAIVWTQELSKNLPAQSTGGLKLAQSIPVLNGGLRCHVNLYHWDPRP